jgi:peptide/nickel transport system substrate-binding protein
MNYAFDFDSFSKATGGTYDPPVGPVPLLFLTGKPNFPYTYDIAKATELLRAAGYSETKQAKMIADFANVLPDEQKAAEILEAGLQKTGLADIEIRPGDFDAIRSYNMGWQKTKDPATAHHLFGLYTPPRMPDPYAYLWYVFDTQAGNNFANNIMAYFNPQFDSLIDQASAEQNTEKRGQLYLQATQTLIDDAAAVYMGTQTKNYVLRKDIMGFFVHPTWYPHVLVYYLSRG